MTIETGKEKKIETEIKIRIHNTREFREKILGLDEGFRVVEPNAFEYNTVFDTGDWRLKKRKCLLRLRRKNNRSVLTFKRPPPRQQEGDPNHYKIREEIEVEVSDFENTKTIIRALGFEVFFIYEKYREVFRNDNGSGNVQIMTDHTPIGDFIEIEGSTAEIDRIASALGFGKKDYITANYYKLFMKTHRTGHMQFK